MRLPILAAMAASAAFVLVVPVAASAEQTSAAPATDTNQPRAAQNPRRVCRAEVETGSLARRRRRCFTQGEWDRIARAARDNVQEQVDRGTSRPGGQ